MLKVAVTGYLARPCRAPVTPRTQSFGVAVPRACAPPRLRRAKYSAQVSQGYKAKAFYCKMTSQEQSSEDAKASTGDKPLLIGITGTLGAGKGAIVELLTEQYGFHHFSARSLISELIKEQGLPLDRPSMVKVANELRAQEGPAAVVERLLVKAQSVTAETGRGAIIESVRTPGEITALRRVGGDGFKLLAVDADSKLRYERAVLRNSETDSVSYEEFVADEAKELDSKEPHKQNLGECIRQADLCFNNNGTMEELYKAVSSSLNLTKPN